MVAEGGAVEGMEMASRRSVRKLDYQLLNAWGQFTPSGKGVPCHHGASASYLMGGIDSRDDVKPDVEDLHMTRSTTMKAVVIGGGEVSTTAEMKTRVASDMRAKWPTSSTAKKNTPVAVGKRAKGSSSTAAKKKVRFGS